MRLIALAEDANLLSSATATNPKTLANIDFSPETYPPKSIGRHEKIAWGELSN